jgi:hypothetical protein
MDAATIFIDILRYAMPSVMVFIIVFLMLKQFFEYQLKKNSVDIRRLNQQTITPLRLQAYERIVLLLERINPGTMAMRLNQQNLSKKELHQLLIANIRNEYEHNVTQQIYMTRTAWEAVKKAKEESIKIINVAATTVPDNHHAYELASAILELSLKLEKTPTQEAIDLLKQEIRSLY